MDMNVHRATCSCSVELYKQWLVYFGGFFAKLGYFAGFFLHIINVAVKISEAATCGVHYIF
jgi:hypothetical protein